MTISKFFVAGFLGAANIVAGDVSDSKGSPEFHMIGGDRVAMDKSKTVNGCKAFFRPQHSQLVAGKPKGDDQNIYIPEKIVYREFLGPTIRYGASGLKRRGLSADTSHDGSGLADLEPSPE